MYPYYNINCSKVHFERIKMKILFNEQLPNLKIKSVDSAKVQALYIYLLINCFSKNVIYKGYNFKAGDILVNILDLAKFLSCSKTTVTKILSFLSDRCYITRETLFLGKQQHILININDSDCCQIITDDIKG